MMRDIYYLGVGLVIMFGFLLLVIWRYGNTIVQSDLENIATTMLFGWGLMWVFSLFLQKYIVTTKSQETIE